MTTMAEKKGVKLPSFDFKNQYAIAADLDIHPGDLLRTSCRWDNSTDSPVSWGENSGDEMCFMYMTYYPKIIASSTWHWKYPARGAACTPVQRERLADEMTGAAARAGE